MEETKRRRFIIRAVLEGEVDVQDAPQPSYNYVFDWDFKNSLTDRVHNYEAVITTPTTGSITQGMDGVSFQLSNIGALSGNVRSDDIILSSGDIVEIKMGETTAAFTGNDGKHGSVYHFGNGAMVQIADPTILLIGWRGQYDKFYAYYNGGWQDIYNINDPDFFSGKTIKIEIGEGIDVYADDVKIGSVALSSDEYRGLVIGDVIPGRKQTFGNMTIEGVKGYRE